MNIAGQIVGVFAVLTFVLSYQFKKRKHILVVNATSSVLYVLQYILLRAYEGAAIDVLSTFSIFTAGAKDKKPLKGHTVIALTAFNLAIVVVGLILYKDIFSLFPIVGAILQTTAFWINDEKIIRLVSFGGGSFWLVYNCTSEAYGAVVGSILTLISIATAIYRYDIKNK